MYTLNMDYLFFLKILFFISFSLYFILNDKLFFKCKSLYGKILIMIHHILALSIIFLGLLFQLYYINIIFVILTALSWLILNQCLISKIHNNLCGFDKNTPFLWIGSIFRKYIGEKINMEIHYKWEFIILIIILGYNIMMIQQRQINKS
jgi:hypothetical protein